MFEVTRTITDDRGRPWTSKTPARPPVVDGERETVAADMPLGCSGWIGLSLLAALLTLGCCCSRGEPQTGIFAAVLVLFGSGVFWAVRSPRTNPAATSRVLLSDWLLANICPGCGYPLGGLREAEDGCVECPECGAAWALARWRRDHPRFASDILEGVRFPKGSVSCWERDARGRWVEMRPLVLPKEAVARARGRMLAALGSTVLTTAGVWFGLRWAEAPVEAAAVGVLVVGTVLGMASMEVRRGELIASRRRMVPGQLARGECPRCLEVLPEVGAISDGARVCGRCGAAWAAAP